MVILHDAKKQFRWGFGVFLKKSFSLKNKKASEFFFQKKQVFINPALNNDLRFILGSIFSAFCALTQESMQSFVKDTFLDSLPTRIVWFRQNRIRIG